MSDGICYLAIVVFWLLAILVSALAVIGITGAVRILWRHASERRQLRRVWPGLR